MPEKEGQLTPFEFFTEIGIIAQLSTSMFEQRLPDGMTRSQFSVLNWFVRVDTEATPTRLATAFQVTGGAMTNTLKKLEVKGYVRIEPDARSGRQKRVTMTASGRQARERAIVAVGDLFEEFQREFPVEKLEGLTGVLAEIRQYLDEYRYRAS